MQDWHNVNAQNDKRVGCLKRRHSISQPERLCYEWVCELISTTTKLSKTITTFYISLPRSVSPGPGGKVREMDGQRRKESGQREKSAVHTYTHSHAQLQCTLTLKEKQRGYRAVYNKFSCWWPWLACWRFSWWGQAGRETGMTDKLIRISTEMFLVSPHLSFHTPETREITLTVAPWLSLDKIWITNCSSPSLADFSLTVGSNRGLPCCQHGSSWHCYICSVSVSFSDTWGNTHNMNVDMERRVHPLTVLMWAQVKEQERLKKSSVISKATNL